MPRIARFTFENAFYHVMTRGNNRQKIFHDDDDFLEYKDTLIHYRKKHDVTIHNYALMENHVHQIVKAPSGKNLSDMMKGINLRYALYYRKKYGGIGHFWQDRFKSFVIQEGIYLLQCARYVELNPVEAGMIELPWDYKWSSCRHYVLGVKDEVIRPNPEFSVLGETSEKQRENYKNFLLDGIRIKERRSEERFFKVGAYGDKEFIRKMNQEGLKSVWSHKGQPKKSGGN